MTIGELVGRERASALLAEAMTAAGRGQGALVFVTGEPGIGKSALVGTAASSAQGDGVLVLSGTCWDGDGAPGYWPWVQVARAYASAIGPEEFDRIRAGAGLGLELLMGRSGTAPDNGAFEIFDAVTRLLMDAAGQQPVLVVLEDLQWADAPSIRLLDFLQHHARLSRLLVIGTYRDVEVGTGDHPLRTELEALAGAATTVPLVGIDRAAVEELLRRGGVEVSEDVVTELHRRSGGNPFFVDQMVQLWAVGGGSGGIAPRVRDAVERRLAHMPSPVMELLASAAILGAEFDADLLMAAVDHPAGDVQRELALAVDARLLIPCENSRLAFVHDLVRETLLDALSDAEARRRHADVCAAITRVPKLRDRVHAAQVAEHAYRAVPEVEASVARDSLREAATSAGSRAAFEEAAGHLRRAVELTDPEDLAEWAELALRLAAVQRRAGELDAARETLATVEERAEDAGEVDLVARSLLEAHLMGHGVDETDDSRGALFAEKLDHAYERLASRGHDGDALGARLLAASARARMHLVGGDREPARASSLEAVEIARTSGDPETLAFCLLARHDAIWRPGTAGERVAIAEEMRRASRVAGDREMELQATMLLMVALLELGDARALDEYDRYLDGAQQSGLAITRYVAQTRMACMALLRGEHVVARRLIDESREQGERLGEVDTYGVWNDQRWHLALREGRLDEIDALLEVLQGRQDSHGLVLEMSLALQRRDARRVGELLDEYERLGSRWPQWAALFWYSSMAEAAELLGEPDLISRSIDTIEPFADLWAVLAGGVLVLGPMRLWLGRLASVQGRWDDAIACCEAALASAREMQSPPVALEARYWKARALLGRAQLHDIDRARSLLSEVVTGASELGMRALEAEARRVLDGDTSSIEEFRLNGEVWTLSYAGATVQAPTTKGLVDLHTLLAHPGVEIPAAVLLDPTADREVVATRQVGADDLLDEQARRAYRQRLEQIDGEIEGALLKHADREAVALEAERDALIEELRHATGLGGRPRQLGSESERARKTVTARIRDTLKRLDTRHPQLAVHLRETITTGTTCAYRPRHDVQWKL